MSVVLVILAAVAGLLGFFVMNRASSAVHEVEGLICFLIFTVALGSAFVVESIRSLKVALSAPRSAPRAETCEGCGAAFQGNGALVQVEGKSKRVCRNCADALIEDAKGQAEG